MRSLTANSWNRNYISVSRLSSAVMLRRPALLMSAPSRYNRSRNSLPEHNSTCSTAYIEAEVATTAYATSMECSPNNKH
jgi:hypothetical protein